MTQITLHDGSIGQELVKRSGDRSVAMWSTRVMIEQPQVVGEVHDAYFAAGATVATTNTYAVLRDRLKRVGLDEEVGRLADIAVSSARKAQESAGTGRVAGAFGPLGASYRADLTQPVDKAVELYAELLTDLREHVDLLLFETMASVEQAEGALAAAAAHGNGLPVWLSVTVADDDGKRLRSGETLDQLAPLVTRYRPAAVLINCSPPEVIGAGLEVLKTFGVPFGAYGNGFTRISEGFLKDAPTVDALEQRTDLTPEAYANFAMGWVDQGATIVGGCCEVGPDHIAELARRLRSAGHEIV
ncbi:homocysteine S-methyltransferase family protein [Roseovarius indicus]|uniref:Homocysteine S-methyltransferase n=1 Tax=Roseovarius indicus TaxID=540747 RepID=A0A0T5PE79_9RHOB|nr:homocysteine S-methyltransferase family protein [Roseovarius indicus]KRS19559.1 homocysteine methyltransferase [Roseovarius indicus]QEW29110.1 Homocysteine S-methyltransferase [Roseovarius indicus]SFD79678.1 homocysteine S-methyltransferase [Roseovarius indicus]